MTPGRHTPPATLLALLALLVLPSAAPAGELPPPRFGGGGGIDAADLPHDEMPPLVRADIERKLAASAGSLASRGLLPAPRPEAALEALAWPLRARGSHADPDFHGVSNYVDLDPVFPNQLLDWNCGTRTYDMANGYNHAGVDYFLWPFQWRMMDAAVIEIVAVAPGVILHKQDGQPDRSCDANASAEWNAVYVQHSDGTVAWYGHMKNGSTTSKAVGQPVAAGEYLGLVGSSGRSSGPHLHLELRSDATAGAAVLEPHAGACRTGPTLWAAQRPYRDSGINKLATHSAEPQFNAGCPNPGQETPNFRNHFRPGVDTLRVAAYFRDQVQGVATTYRLLRRGQVWQQWQHASPQTWNAAWWSWLWQPLPAAAAHGTWVFEAVLGNQTARHEFTVGTDILLATTFGG